jgi:hypothetical protein
LRLMSFSFLMVFILTLTALSGTTRETGSEVEGQP